jgi:hypothetical protein
VKIIAEELLKKEVLFKDDLKRLIGDRPFKNDTDDNASVGTIVTQEPVDFQGNGINLNKTEEAQG